jgi:SAM-dependent methyltransferase
MFTLADVVPWGRSFDEYRRMFALTDADLGLGILGCGDGPASFNAVATRRGARVVSCDPIYGFGVDALRTRIDATRDEILGQTRRHADEFVWRDIPSVEALEALRTAAMLEFLADYPSGRTEARYVDGALPRLPFDDGAFDLAVCSHLLFLYSSTLDEAFHLASVREMCRVAAEVRLFPLLALGAVPSSMVAPVVDDARACGHRVSIETVDYEFQRGGNQMTRIRVSAGAVGVGKYGSRTQNVEPRTQNPERRTRHVRFEPHDF